MNILNFKKTIFTAFITIALFSSPIVVNATVDEQTTSTPSTDNSAVTTTTDQMPAVDPAPSTPIIDTTSTTDATSVNPTTTTISTTILDTISDSTSSTPTTSPSNNTTTSSSTTATTVNINIRYQNNLIFSGLINLATSTIIIDNKGNSETTTSTSVLTALINAQQQTPNFSISNLQHSNYGYYLKCLYLSLNSTSTCDNWNYVVDNIYPNVGMDSYPLKGGENIYIYFGDSWKITTNDNIYTNTSTPFYTWRYDYSDISHDWVMDPNDLVAITVANPHSTGWWDADITVSTTLSNDRGLATYNFSSTGTYSAKITSDDYSKWSNPITFAVTDTPPTMIATSSSNTTSTSDVGGSATTATNQLISNDKINNTINKILNFLKMKQGTDGKIVDTNTSDWAAMSFGAKTIYAADVKNGGQSLYDFVYNEKNEDIEKENNKCTGYSRHLLTLLSVGVAKNDPKIIELKNKLDTVCVQNNSFGLPGINDDVFGLIAALALDESPTATTVNVALSGIKADQQADGSFTWSGTSGSDITGAAINALQYAKNKGVNIDNRVFTNAKNYLKKQQLSDGGWCYDPAWCNNTSDALTTSWVVMGLNALGETQNDWFKNTKNPWTILINLDGVDHYNSAWSNDGVDWFATKHAVPALNGNIWPIILTPKQNTTSNQNGGSNLIAQNVTMTTTTTATSTSKNTTTTTIATTSTIPTLQIATTTTIIAPITSSSMASPIVSETVDLNIPKTEQKIEPKINQSKDNLPSTIQNIAELQTPPDKNQIIDNLPLDTPTKRNAKKILALSGGSALVVGAYLGLRLLRNMI